MSDEKLQLDITAKDDASKTVDALQKKVDKLETSDTTVDVAADTGDAVDDVDSFAKKLSKLSDSDQVVVLALRAGAAQSELTDLATQLATIDSSDPTIDVKLDRYAEVAGDLDQLETKMKAIASTSVDPDVGDKARTRLAGIGEEAGKASGAVHSMAGNAIGDFAATATGVGPLGEALGQLSETALDAEGSIGEIAAAGASMGGLAAAMYVVNKTMQSIADSKAFHTEEIDAYTKAISAGGDAAQALTDRLTAAGKVMATPSLTNASNWLGFSDTVRDVTAQINAAGLSVDQYTQLVTGSKEAVGEWAQAQLDAGANGKLIANVLDVIAQAQKDYATATKNAQTSTEFFYGATDDAGRSVRALNAQAEEWQAKADAYQRETQQTTDKLKLLKGATDDVTSAFDQMSGRISQDQSLIDLQNQLDNVTQAGRDAMTAQHDADVARASGAADANEKAAAAAQAMRDYQTDVNNAKQAIIDIGKTAGATPVDVNSSLEAIDQGDLVAVKNGAEAWYRGHPIDAATRLKLIGIITGGVGLPVNATVPTLNAAPATTITNNNYLAAAVTGRQLATTSARHARINGR